MGMFDNILSKLGIGEERTAASDQATARATARHPGRESSGSANTPAAANDSTARPAEMSMVDVAARLEQRAATNPQKLNWQSSIVDMLKLLDMDSSLEARKELARELGAPAEVMQDSAQMNVWLHKTVLRRIAANGGNVPRDLVA